MPVPRLPAFPAKVGPRPRFSETDLKRIAQLVQAGVSNAAIAERFGRPKASIGYVIKRRGLRGPG